MNKLLKDPQKCLLDDSDSITIHLMIVGDDDDVISLYVTSLQDGDGPSSHVLFGTRCRGHSSRRTHSHCIWCPGETAR